MNSLDITAVKPPILCRLGFHSWFSDGCGIFAADRCNNCFEYRSKGDARKMDFAHQLIAEEDAKGGDFRAAMERAALRFATETPP